MSGNVSAAPELSPRELVDRVAALRPLLRDQQELTEQRTRPSEEIFEALRQAGLFRLYVPRRYGGLEFDPVTFMRVCVEMGRGDMSAGWCMALASSHALQIASWMPRAAQDEIFASGGPDFRCASVAAPIARCERVGENWELSGQVGYCSGLPFSSHYLGQGIIVGPDGRSTKRMLLFVAPRDQFEMLEDWGGLVGLKGSGSNSILFDRGRVPAGWAIEDALMVDFDVTGGTPGLELHGNPMYGGRAMALFTLTLGALAVGGAHQLLDEYEAMLDSKMSVMPPFVPRRQDAAYQRWFGSALARIGTAEAAILSATEQHLEACRRAAEEGVPYTYYEDWRLSCIGREAIAQIWDVVQGEIVPSAGSSAAAEGSRLVRVFHDLSMLPSHRNMLMRDWAYGEIAREYLGLPRSGPGNVQTPDGGRPQARF